MVTGASVALCFFFGILSGTIAGYQNDTVVFSRPGVVNIGALFNFNSVIGKAAKVAVDLAVDDVNRNSSILPETRLNVITQDTSCSGFLGIVEALKLMEKDVVAIIGPQSSGIAHVISNVVNELHVPILSFSATDPSLSAMQFPYFIRMTRSDYFQMNAVASIVEYYGWREVTAIFVDDDYGRAGISALGDTLAKRRSKISYKAAFPPNAKDVTIMDLLVRVNLMESRVYVVHVNPDSGMRLFSIAKDLGMMGTGYAWIATDWLPSVLDSSRDLNTMELLQGVVTLRHHTPDSDIKKSFLSRWNGTIRNKNISTGLNSYGLYAYDSVWVVAHALDKFLAQGKNISFSNDPLLHDDKRSSLDLTPMHVFNGGEDLRQILLRTDFTGITGQVQFAADRELIHPAYDILNLEGTSVRSVGFWSGYSGLSVIAPEILYMKAPNISTLSQQLYTVIWPGGTSTPPKGWVFPDNGKPLRIGVPNRASYKEFASKSSGPENVEGFCIDVFNEAIKLLSYPVPTEFIPIGNGETNPNNDDIIRMVAENELDAAVGDISIVRNRTKIVDFTQPYIESGLVIVVPIEERRSDTWAFLKPFTWEMWLVTFAFFFVVGAVVWILEHRMNKEFRGSPRQQVETMFWFSFSTMFYAHRQRPASSLGRFILIIWLFVVLIVKSSYTSNLTSIITVQQLSSGITGLDSLISSSLPVGYQVGKFTKNYLMEELNIPQSRLVPLVRPEEYARALDLGPQKPGGVAAIVDEVPYVNIFLSMYCRYKVVGQEFTKSGWGFAFQRDSPLAVDLSAATLQLSESGDLQKLHDKWLSQRDCESQDSAVESSRLSLRSFWGLFLVCGLVCFLVCVVFFTRLCCQYRKFSAGEEGDKDRPSRVPSIKDLFSFADMKEENMENIIKRKSSDKKSDQTSEEQQTPPDQHNIVVQDFSDLH